MISQIRCTHYLLISQIRCTHYPLIPQIRCTHFRLFRKSVELISVDSTNPLYSLSIYSANPLH
ncbi:MAG: hypothetical protein KAI83_07630 [Thiomargarita sp.]|nr:hypothetical protein [Thiomargarita sp.]